MNELETHRISAACLSGDKVGEGWHDIASHVRVNGFRFALPLIFYIYFWSLRGLLEELLWSSRTSQILVCICSRLRRKSHQIATLGCPTPNTQIWHSEHVNTQIWQSHPTGGNWLSNYPIMIAVAQRNMEVRFLQRAPRGSLTFGFASPLVCTFGAPQQRENLWDLGIRSHTIHSVDVNRWPSGCWDTARFSFKWWPQKPPKTQTNCHWLWVRSSLTLWSEWLGYLYRNCGIFARAWAT